MKWFLLPLIVSATFQDSLWGWNNHTNGYYENLPRPRNYTNRREKDSACANGQASNEYGFACPHMMMFSADMLLASQYDRNDNDFYYAVGGAYSDDICGACYQVQLFDAEQIWNSNIKQLIIQVFNSGGDVTEGQFDIFMGAGGFGWYTAANSDCYTNHCGGGACRSNIYAGSWNQWNNAKYYDQNICYSGGIKWLNETTSDMCLALSNYENNLKDKILYDSCYLSNHYFYHQNFVSTRSLRVQCPKGLYMLTGLQRADDEQYPVPHIENLLNIQFKGDRQKRIYSITTMSDMCKPSASWNYKGNPSQQWPRMDTCNSEGIIYDYY